MSAPRALVTCFGAWVDRVGLEPTSGDVHFGLSPSKHLSGPKVFVSHRKRARQARPGFEPPGRQDHLDRAQHIHQVQARKARRRPNCWPSGVHVRNTVVVDVGAGDSIGTAPAETEPEIPLVNLNSIPQVALRDEWNIHLRITPRSLGGKCCPPPGWAPFLLRVGAHSTPIGRDDVAQMADGRRIRCATRGNAVQPPLPCGRTASINRAAGLR